jgi:AraC-like DNA-binding protein
MDVSSPTEPVLQFRQWSSLHAYLAWIYEGATPETYQNNRCQPDFLGAWLVLKGQVEVKQAGAALRASAGQWLILGQATGRQDFLPGTRILSLRFRAEWPDRKPLFEAGLPHIIQASEEPELEARARALLRAVKPIAPACATELRLQTVHVRDFIRVQRGFWSWLEELHEALERKEIHSTRTGIHDERVSEVLHILDHLPLSEKINESELAGKAGLSTAHFVRLFRDAVGSTPKRYLSERRHDCCRRLLAAADMPIKEIAITLGFLRLSDFSAWFSTRYGVSPRRYRQFEQQRTSLPKTVLTRPNRRISGS